MPVAEGTILAYVMQDLFSELEELVEEYDLLIKHVRQQSGKRLEVVLMGSRQNLERFAHVEKQVPIQKQY